MQDNCFCMSTVLQSFSDLPHWLSYMSKGTNVLIIHYWASHHWWQGGMFLAIHKRDPETCQICQDSDWEWCGGFAACDMSAYLEQNIHIGSHGYESLGRTNWNLSTGLCRLYVILTYIREEQAPGTMVLVSKAQGWQLCNHDKRCDKTLDITWLLTFTMNGSCHSPDHLNDISFG